MIHATALVVLENWNAAVRLDAQHPSRVPHRVVVHKLRIEGGGEASPQQTQRRFDKSKPGNIGNCRSPIVPSSFDNRQFRLPIVSAVNS
jgi:hypothetical protein